MSTDKKQKILELVRELVEEKQNAETWKEGDWVKYSGPHFDADEYTAAIDNLLDGWFITGKKNAQFEDEFPRLLGKRYGSFTNSGSSANLLMLSAARSKKLWNFKPGTKIITPVVCFPTTINPIIQNGFEPVFVDVDLPSLNLNLDEVERILEENWTQFGVFTPIKGICFAHVLGNPPDMDRLMGLVEKYDLVFFEDACDALGSTYDDKVLGSFGNISTCSFFPAHHMSTGEGGFVACNEKKIVKVIDSFKSWGRSCYCGRDKPGDVTAATACGNRFKKWLPGLPEVVFDHRYVFEEIGYNIKPLDLQGAIGLEQIKKLPEMEQARRDNFNKLFKIFRKYKSSFHLPVATPKSDPCWFGFLLTVKDDADFTKQEFVDFLENHKIQTRSYFTGNALAHPAYKEYADKYNDIAEAFPVATKVTSDTFFLGTYIGLTQEKIDYIQKMVDKFFKNKSKLKVLQ